MQRRTYLILTIISTFDFAFMGPIALKSPELILNDPETFKCLPPCICGDLRKLRKTLNNEITEGSKQGRGLETVKDIIDEAIRIHGDDSAAFGILCIGHAFKFFPLFNDIADEENNSTSHHANITSIIVLQRGQLEMIRADDLQIFSTELRVLDLSHNQIRTIEKDALDGCSQLKVIDLQYNLLTTVGDYNLPTQMPRVIISLEGNPLTCSCLMMQTIINHFLIPDDDMAVCYPNVTSQTSTQVNITRAKNGEIKDQSTERNDSISLTLFISISKAIFSPCIEVAETAAPMNASVNKRPSSPVRFEDDDQRYSFIAVNDIASNRTSYALQRKSSVDYPLLITMSGWFLMVFFGLTKFIRSNTMDYEMHKNYLLKLDEQKNPAVKFENRTPGASVRSDRF